MRAFDLLAGALIASTGLVSAPALAQSTLPPSLRDSFRLGSGGGVLCQVQATNRDKVIQGMFDRAWSIVCRDAARPIGKLYAIRGDAAGAMARLAALRTEASCTGETRGQIEGLGAVAVSQCKLNDADVGYTVYLYDDGKVSWVAEGLSGYDSALQLGLRSIVADRIVDGQVQVATTSVGDPVAFARVQAGALDPDQALAEGYRRNNSGDYAEAAEFFGTLQERADAIAANPEREGEYLVNEALQKSNLGEFAEADPLFAEAERIPTTDQVQVRLRRNFRAVHLLNQQRLAEALAVLDEPVKPVQRAIPVAGSAIEIGRDVAAEINRALPVAQRLGATEVGTLTPEERAVILDAQALQLRGTILRLHGQPGPALAALQQARDQALSVRQGRVVSIIRFRSQILAEIAAAHEAQGDFGAAESNYREAIALLELRYPQTTVLNAARGRLAGYLARRGQRDAALTLYRDIVGSTIANGNSATGLSNTLAPYFALLAEQVPSQPALVEDFFLATQTLVRPGVADTQAQLARELSEGTSEASRLFRQATVLSRDIERLRIEIANARANAGEGGANTAQVAALEAELATLERDQSITQARLSEFPQYRALSTDTITLAELRQTLGPEEAYLKLSVVGPDVYGLYVSPADATAWRLPISAAALDRTVDELRRTITTQENGELVTYPFDVALARGLFLDIAGPVEAQIKGVRQLVFEPDGAMLRLPPGLMVAGQEGVDAYAQRTASPRADKFDFRGVEWLGRDRAVSVAVSAKGFRDARRAPRSAATREYLGFGQNQPVFATVRLAATRAVGGGEADGCQWPLSEWNKPISAAELVRAQSVLGAKGAEVVTGAAFTDDSVVARDDLTNYRILHFATHGLVTAPRPQCPARPALLTSFGGADSDGLLSFREIYDMRIDADLVILSACDTAGRATIEATREAGVTSGGGNALDGLVRAFIGAGGRSVLASHWPAPDDFNATQRLIAGMFENAEGVTVGESLRRARVALMDDPATSHPYYWAGFVIIGDGGQQMLAAR